MGIDRSLRSLGGTGGCFLILFDAFARGSAAAAAYYSASCLLCAALVMILVFILNLFLVLEIAGNDVVRRIVGDLEMIRVFNCDIILD